MIDVHFGGEEIRQESMKRRVWTMPWCAGSMSVATRADLLRKCCDLESCCYDFSAAELRAVGDAHHTTGDQGESSPLEGDGRS